MTAPRRPSTLESAFPFSAVVGADEVKLALLLAAVDPAIGGVLLRGDKGSAKSTLARGLASLLPDGAPFVELPLGATEERVVGSLDLAAALGGGEVRFQPGLLAGAHGGVLYVDEVNLLADHLVDLLLDAAASGINRVERDGVSHSHPARFLLVGSMNPEEGDLRPQLLDRFGLAVDVRNPSDPEQRAEVVRRRRTFDADPACFVESWAAAEAGLATRLADAGSASVDDDLLTAACAVCVAAGAESLRADIVLVRSAAAHAGWHGRSETTADDVRAVAPLVLAHRQRRDPLDHSTSSNAVQDALDDALPPLPDGEPPGGDDRGGDGPADRDESSDGAGDGSADERTGADTTTGAGPATPVVTFTAPRVEAASGGGRRSTVLADRGRSVGHRGPTGPVGAVAVVPTIATAAARRAADPTSPTGVVAADLREPVRETRTGNLLVLAVDASGSMGADDRMVAVKGALLGLLVDAYQRRDRVSLVTFRGTAAEVVLRPTGSVEVARARLEGLTTGGETPLAAGITVAADLARRSSTDSLRPLLVVVTDGRATAGEDAVAAAMRAARSVAHHRLPAVVVDVEPSSGARLGLAADLATAMSARHLPLPSLTAGRLESALRTLRPAPPPTGS